MRATDRSGIVVFVAMALATLTLLPLTQDVSYVPLALLLVLFCMTASVVLRRLGVNNGVVLGVQVAVLLVFLGSIAWSLGGPDGGLTDRIVDLYTSATEHMRTQAAPMEPQPGVKLLMVTAVGLVTVMTDVLVEGIDRPAWALAPPLTLYLVPALGLTADISWPPFVCLAAGYLLILMSEGVGTAEAWPRNVDAGRSRSGGVGAFAARTAALIGVPVVVLALLLGSAVPLPGQPGWGLSRARGNNGPLQLADPTLDIKRNLTQPEDATVLTYRTDQPTGTYLRMAALPVINDNGWQNTSVSLTDNRQLSPVPGRDVSARLPRRTSISIGDFSSEYLPMPYAPRSFTAQGQFAHDPNSLVVIGTGANRAQATRNLSYDVDSWDIEPDGSRLSGEEAGTPADANLTSAVPADIPPEIIDLTLRITRNQPTPALKAAAIQAYLRSDRFTYSTDPQPGSTYQQLTDFLLRDRRGYCEQFAAAMGLMARIVGIPSRVDVGFLPGERNGDHWEVTIRDMHAWPELYFEQDGWVRFEPTPSVQTGRAPSWTVEADSSDSDQQPSAEPTASGQQQTEAAQSPSPTASDTPSAAPVDTRRPFPWGRVGGGLGLLVLVGAAASVPFWLRRRQRRDRLGLRASAAETGPTPARTEDAWAEVRATVLDYADPWPAGTPRTIADDVGARLPAESATALRTLAEQVERVRFARVPSPGDVAASGLAQQVVAGVEADRSWDQRFVARWWPRSFWGSVAARLPGRR